ncbi:MAG TPA: carbohydrate kinase family protein, partial [Candidatus Paceibacterota bacterium]
PSVATNVVDVSGCGDAFAAGYLVSLHEGNSPEEALALGSLMGAINCEFLGYMKNLDRKTIDSRKPTGFVLKTLRG